MLLFLLAVLSLMVLATALAALAYTVGMREERERQRVELEYRLAEWQSRQLTRSAMTQMLHEARQDRGRNG
jgi:hypothetical protein